MASELLQPLNDKHNRPYFLQSLLYAIAAQFLLPEGLLGLSEGCANAARRRGYGTPDTLDFEMLCVGLGCR